MGRNPQAKSKARHDRKFMKQIAALGGKAVLKQNGREHFQELAKKKRGMKYKRRKP